MSGHSSFRSIGSGGIPNMPANPQANENIGIGGNQPVGGAAVGGVGGSQREGQQNVQANGSQESSSALIRQLDILLMRAAVNATKAVDAGAVKRTLQKLELPAETRNAIGEAADRAEAAFKAINTFIGRQLGESVKAENGKFDWGNGNPAAEAIRKAIDAQLDISDLLRKIVNRLPACDIANTLEEAVFQCDRRASEIQTLVCEFADIAENAENAGPEVRARLDATLEKLLPRKTLEMHDSTAAITAMKTQVEPLARRLDTISKHPEASLSKQEVAAIKREIDMMSNALDAAAKSGRANGVFADRSLLGAAKDVLNEVKGKITNARSEISNASLRNFADKVFYTPNIKILEPRFMPFLKVVAPVLATAVQARERLCTAAKDYASKPDKENLRRLKQHRDAFAAINEKDLRQSIQNLLVYTHKDKVENGETIKVALNANSVTTKIRDGMTNLGDQVLTDEMKADLQEFVTLLLAFRSDTKKAFKEHKTSPMHEIDAVYYHPKGVAAQAAHLELMGKNANSLNDLKFQTNGTVLAAFEGKLRFTTLVEARLRGIDDGDVDPRLDDINVESSKTLGSGKVNTVYEVTCKDGSKHIFKPEAEGRKAIESIFLTFGMDDMQMIVGLNMASQKVADALGLDDVMTKTTVGSHKGSFGMFMEKAPGVTADDWSNPSKSEKLPAGQLSPAGIKGLYDEEYAIVVGGLMQKANRLEWFDLITGQGDRHPANYMMSVNQLDNSVTLKGIDNDACFPAYRKGIRTFALDVPNTQKFKEQLAEIAKELYPDKGPEAVNQQDPGLAARFAEDLFNRDPAITKNKDGSITVDTTKAASPLIAVALMNAIGLQTTALPDYIDEELYNHLMELGRSGQARKTFIAGMKAHLSPAAADAAVKRLDEAVALAKRRAREHKVISKMDWFDANVQFELVGKINRRGNGFKKIQKVVEGYPDFSEKGEKKVAAKYEFVSNGYFRRDIVRAIAKRGWFDE